MYFRQTWANVSLPNACLVCFFIWTEYFGWNVAVFIYKKAPQVCSFQLNWIFWLKYDDIGENRWISCLPHSDFLKIIWDPRKISVVSDIALYRGTLCRGSSVSFPNWFYRPKFNFTCVPMENRLGNISVVLYDRINSSLVNDHLDNTICDMLTIWPWPNFQGHSSHYCNLRLKLFWWHVLL